MFFPTIINKKPKIFFVCIIAWQTYMRIFSMSRYHLPVPMYIDVPHGILLLYNTIVYVSLNSMDKTAFNLFYNTYMVAYAIVLPVKEDNITGGGRVIPILPCSFGLEPVDTVGAISKFRYINVQHTALSRAP